CLQGVPVLSKIAHLNQLFTTRTASPAAEVKLTRKTYALPQAKAEALAAFLREYVKAAVLETKVDGDSLTITTTPEVQKGIGQLLSVLKDLRAARDVQPEATDVIPWNSRWLRIPVKEIRIAAARFASWSCTTPETGAIPGNERPPASRT